MIGEGQKVTNAKAQWSFQIQRQIKFNLLLILDIVEEYQNRKYQPWSLL